MNPFTIHQGNNLDVLPTIADESQDLVLTDPPYGISFMGKSWDKALPTPQTWKECLRVLKPGGFAVVMSGSRLDCLWRMCRDIEEAGFELNQTAMVWVTRQGFPKGQDFSKAYDQRVGAEREVVGVTNSAIGPSQSTDSHPFGKTDKWNTINLRTAPATETAKELDGWFSKGKIKPAIEFLIVARKPISEKTEIDNMLKHGVGGVNCGECMVPFGDDTAAARNYGRTRPDNDIFKWEGHSDYNPTGRFPANLMVSNQALGPEDSRYFDLDKWASEHGYSDDWAAAAEAGVLQIAKPNRGEKNAGCEGLEKHTATVTMALVKQCANCGGKAINSRGLACGCDKPTPILVKQAEKPRANHHPTCKPVTLMAYLISLLTKPNAHVLDPFCGSGTTLVAAIQTNRIPTGIELDCSYVEIARARATHAATLTKQPAQQTLL